jgi:hypothetical protein
VLRLILLLLLLLLLLSRRPKESFMSQTLNAFDFAAVRSKRDAELLYEAKYGERGPGVQLAATANNVYSLLAVLTKG